MPDFFISQFYHSVNNLKNMVQYTIEFNNHKEKYKGNVMEKIYKIVAEELKIPVDKVENTIKLLDDGATIPFVARYRKEITGNLDEVQIGDILQKVEYLRNLEERKEEVIRLIEEQGKLTEELRNSIIEAKILQEVEDIYFPYRKKKKTKADIAKERGLEPLSEKFYSLNNLEEIINQFIDHYTNKEIELYTPTIYGKISQKEFILKEMESSNGNFCKKVFPQYARYIQTRDLSKVDISTVSNSDFIQRITLEKNKNALAIKTASEVGSVKQATEIFEVINAMPNIPTVTLNSHTYDIRNLSNLEIRNAIDKIPQVSFLLSNILIRTGEELDLGSKGIYKVKSGDTLSTIAQRNGMVTKELLKLNTWLADEGRVKFLKNKVLVESNILELNEIDHVLVGDRNAENILIDANKGDNTLVGGNKKIS